MIFYYISIMKRHKKLFILFILLSLNQIFYGQESQNDFDENTYEILMINNQAWSSKNLNVSHYRNGDSIYQVNNAKDWENYANEGMGAWCYYNNEPSMSKIYGKLYNWYAVNDPRGLAPENCHIPKKQEFTSLIEFYESLENDQKVSKVSINKLEKTVMIIEGHFLFPGGFISYNGDFNGVEESGYWWTSTEYALNDAWYKGFNLKTGKFLKGFYDKGDGKSIRFIKDK